MGKVNKAVKKMKLETKRHAITVETGAVKYEELNKKDYEAIDMIRTRPFVSGMGFEGLSKVVNGKKEPLNDIEYLRLVADCQSQFVDNSFKTFAKNMVTMFDKQEIEPSLGRPITVKDVSDTLYHLLKVGEQSA